jgi:hypothetical protein
VWIRRGIRRRVTVDAFAEGSATWKKAWRRGARTASASRLRAKADFAIYTPGSRAGRPVSILESFNAPAEDGVGTRRAER